jgi:uncharacterized protein
MNVWKWVKHWVGICLIVASAGCAGSKHGARVGHPLRVLHIGGGASHDYERWFNQEDSAILRELGDVDVRYTDQPDTVLQHIAATDLLILSNNRAYTNAASRQAVMQFAEAGKPIVLLHPGLWYNWADWPEYNRVLAGGGSRGHDRLGEFGVTVDQPSHPLFKGVPSSFRLIDELYWFEADPAGTPVTVLATAHSAQKNKTYPMVFVVHHPKARIVGITLGHDARAHEHPAFRQLLKNAVTWAARR